MIPTIEILTFLCLLSCLAGITFQDFKSYKVSLLFYATGLCIAIINGILINTFTDYLITFFVNIFIIGFQLLLVWLYLIIKNKSKIQLNNYLGEGDLFFWAIMAASFSNFNFIVFQVVSLIIVMMVHLSLMKLKKAGRLIPLAGYQALLLGICLIVDFSSPNFSCYNDFIEYLL